MSQLPWRRTHTTSLPEVCEYCDLLKAGQMSISRHCHHGVYAYPSGSQYAIYLQRRKRGVVAITRHHVNSYTPGVEISQSGTSS